MPDGAVPHIARCTMIGPVAADVPQAERTPVRVAVTGAVLVPGNVIQVLITV